MLMGLAGDNIIAYETTDQFVGGEDLATFLSSKAMEDEMGWWHCCQCGAHNNPAVSGWTCPVCYHDKCDYCYILQR
jgi:hypothetical protein